MKDKQTSIHLTPYLFQDKERTFIEAAPFTASVFRYPSGAAGLRLKNEAGQLVLLPYQGQQIWDAELGGRRLTMKSIFVQPRPMQAYLAEKTKGNLKTIPAHGQFHCSMLAGALMPDETTRMESKIKAIVKS